MSRPWLRSIDHYLRLPAQVTQFEREYLGRVNRIARMFFVLHVPVLTLIAATNHTRPLMAFALSALCAAGPVFASRLLSHPRATALVSGLASTCMGGLLVHFGQGPMQIEMHFYFFVVIAILAVFANPTAILIAALTVAGHHALLFVLLPRSVFNYEASTVVVLVHALFVVLESVAACFVARSFFDNVIGLEAKVAQRTSEIVRRTRDMSVLLDNVGQGFVGVGMDGRLASEQSKALTRWLGVPKPAVLLWDYVASYDSAAAAWLKLGWESLADGVFPLELVVDQLPRRMTAGPLTLALEYRTVFAGDRLEQIVVIFSDVTFALERDRLEEQKGETVALFERLVHDREGLVEFINEASARIRAIAKSSSSLPLVDVKRHLHTLKGNCAFFELNSIARRCHDLESRIDDSQEPLTDQEASQLAGHWQALTSSVGSMLGDGPRRIELSSTEHQQLRRGLVEGESRASLVRFVDALLLESMQRRLERIGEQSRFLAQRLGKGDITVRAEANGLRLPWAALGSFWATLGHVVRNAIDHGLETPEERVRRGKPPAGTIALRMDVDGNELVISTEDDGGGIDWAKVRERAEDAGLPHATPEDLEEALFADGLSSKDDVDEVSGRGVGMGAVRAAVQEFQGRLVVHSRRHQGARFEARFPRERLTGMPEEPGLVEAASGNWTNDTSTSSSETRTRTSDFAPAAP